MRHTYDDTTPGTVVRVLWPDMRPGAGRITDTLPNCLYVRRFFDGRLEQMSWDELNARLLTAGPPCGRCG